MSEGLVGTSIVLSLDGQKVTGRVTAIQADKMVVRLTILQPARAYQGVKAMARLPDGQEVAFDLGGHAYFSELLIEVPLPRSARLPVTPRPPAEVPTAVEPKLIIKKPAEPRELTAPTEAEKLWESAREKPALNRIAAEAEAGAEAPPAPPPPPKPPGDERRHYFRFAVDCQVDLVENVGHTREYVRAEGRTLNLSGGGMLAEFGQPVPPGKYRFRLYLGDEPMLLTGRVIKKGEHITRVAAIEFADLHEADRSKLIRFIFNMMRTLKQAARGAILDENAKKAEPKPEREKEKAHVLRREKYFKPKKIRYW